MTGYRWYLIAVLFLVAFLLRVGIGAWQGLSAAPPSGSDAAEYDQYAWNLAQGNGYRGRSPDVADQDHLTAYRPPGPSIMWAGIYKLFGHDYAAVRVANSLLGALSCVLVFFLGRRAFSERVGALAAIIWAAFPTSLYYSPTLSSEPLLLVAFLGFLLASLEFAHKPSVSAAAVAGALLGLTLLVHPSKVVMVPLAVVWVLWQFRGNARQLAVGLTIPLFAAVVLSPWVVRNFIVFDEFIPFSTMGGSVLLQGNNRIVATDPRLRGYVIWDTKIPEYADALRAPNDEVQRDRIARELAVEWISQNPGLWVSMVPQKLKRGLTPFLQPGSSSLETYGLLLSWGPILLLSTIAFPITLACSLQKRTPAWLLHLAILHFLIITVVFFGYARYRYAIEPVCVLLAAWLICKLVGSIWRARRPAAFA